MSNRFLVGIFGGVGSGKKLLAQKLTRHIRDPRIEIFHDFSKIENPNYSIFIDKPYDRLLEKYVLSLPARILLNKSAMAENLAEFRKFHMEKVIPQKKGADFWFTGEVEKEDDKIHQLALEILRKRINFDDDENVKIYLESNHGNGPKAHPMRATISKSKGDTDDEDECVAENASRIEKCVNDQEMRQGSENAPRIVKCVKDPEKRQGSRNASSIGKYFKNQEMRQSSRKASKIEKCVKDQKKRQGSRNASRIEKCVKDTKKL